VDEQGRFGCVQEEAQLFAASTTTGTVQVRVRFVNSDGALQRIWSVNLSTQE